MSSYLTHRAASLHRDEAGQMAFVVLLSLMVVFTLFALAFDTGLWFFDHRTAQNQADAAALAAAQYLPTGDATQLGLATEEAKKSLARNGFPGQSSCPVRVDPSWINIDGLEYRDQAGNDGLLDTVRVCVRRGSPGTFARLSGISSVRVSAAATVTADHASISNVLPWAIVPPDPTCAPGNVCQNDPDGAGPLGMTPCGVFLVCPWGLSLERLYTFKVSSSVTPGNFGAIAACGQGTSNYLTCVNGSANSGFFAAGQTVMVGTQTGTAGSNTNTALEARYAPEGADGVYECDVESTPDPVTGLDSDGKAAAIAKFVDPVIAAYGLCPQRLIPIPIIFSFPASGNSEPILVLGIATFGIAKWDRHAPWGDGLGTSTPAPGAPNGKACGDPSLTSGYECGMVWGYLIPGVRPPSALLEQTGGNFLAPIIIVMTE